MVGQTKYFPGDPVPAGGTYEMLSALGSLTGIRADLLCGQPFPPAPLWHKWVLVGDAPHEGAAPAADEPWVMGCD